MALNTFLVIMNQERYSELINTVLRVMSVYREVREGKLQIQKLVKKFNLKERLLLLLQTKRKFTFKMLNLLHSFCIYL